MDNVLPEVLKSLRKEKSVSQKEIAEYLNIDRTTYTKYESGDSSPDYDKLLKLADYFNVSVDRLLGRKETDYLSGYTNDSEQKIPAWATKKDIRDFRKLLEEEPLMFDGMPLDDEDKEKILRVVEAVFWDAKKRNKRKPIDE